MDLSAGLLIKAAMVNDLVVGDFIQLKAKASAVFVKTATLYVAYVRKANPRLIVFAVCDQVGDIVSFRTKDDRLEFCGEHGAVKLVLQKLMGRAEIICWSKMQTSNVDGSLLNVRCRHIGDPIEVFGFNTADHQSKKPKTEDMDIGPTASVFLERWSQAMFNLSPAVSAVAQKERPKPKGQAKAKTKFIRPEHDAAFEASDVSEVEDEEDVADNVAEQDQRRVKIRESRSSGGRVTMYRAFFSKPPTPPSRV
jgi:hypothetical protein